MRADHPTVLIVDDEFDIRLLVRVLLETAGLEVEVVGEAADGLDALRVFETLSPPDVPDVVILDNRMPGRDGLEVAADMLAAHPTQHIILFSAYLTPELTAHADEIGIDACVGKTDVDRLPELVAGIVRGDPQGRSSKGC